MLVLTRRAGESIVIGDDVRVVVLDVRGDTIRLGIEAPRSVQVHRAEVYAEVHAANASAAGSTSTDLAAAAERLQRLARPRQQRPRKAAAEPTPKPAPPARRPVPPGPPPPGPPPPGPPSSGQPPAVQSEPDS